MVEARRSREQDLLAEFEIEDNMQGKPDLKSLKRKARISFYWYIGPYDDETDSILSQ